MLHRDRVEREYKALYSEIGLGTTIWSPLASGLLTGKYSDRIPKESRLDQEKYDWLRKTLLETEEGKAKLMIVQKLLPVAEDLGITLAQLALAWCLKNPDVSTVITGASSVEQVEQNLCALNVVNLLDDEVMERIEEILGNKPPSEHDWRP